MDEILTFLGEHVLDIVRVGILLLVSILIFLRTGDKKIFKEVLEMEKKYRTENYQDKSPVKGQTFNRYQRVFKLNQVTNELEVTDEVIDIQEMVNSCKSMCMTEILDKFLPNIDTLENDTVQEVVNMEGDLDFMQEAFLTAQDYKKKYNLSEDMSVEQVFDFVSKQRDLVSKRVDYLKGLQEKKEEVKGNEDEKAPLEESK